MWLVYRSRDSFRGNVFFLRKKPRTNTKKHEDFFTKKSVKSVKFADKNKLSRLRFNNLILF